MTPSEFEQEAAFLAELEDWLREKGDEQGLLLTIKAHANLQLMLEAEPVNLRAENKALELKMWAHRETAVAAITGAEKQVDALRADAEAIARERDGYRAENQALRADVERLRVQVEETARECGVQKTDNERLRPALRQILEDPDAKILDAHRDDGWEALARPKDG